MVSIKKSLIGILLGCVSVFTLSDVDDTKVFSQQPSRQNYKQPQDPRISPQPLQNLYRTSFVLVGKRRIRRLERNVMDNSFCVDSNVWNNLRPDMNKRELFHALQNATILNVSDVLYHSKGLKKYITNQDIYRDFIKASDRLAREFPQDFTSDDKRIFDSIVRRELQSDQRINFPKGSKIYLQVGTLSSVDIRLEKSEDYPLIGIRPHLITDPSETRALRRFYSLALITEDEEVPGYDGNTIRCPLDKLYILYRSGTKRER